VPKNLSEGCELFFLLPHNYPCLHGEAVLSRAIAALQEEVGKRKKPGTPDSDRKCKSTK